MSLYLYFLDNGSGSNHHLKRPCFLVSVGCFFHLLRADLHPPDHTAPPHHTVAHKSAIPSSSSLHHTALHCAATHPLGSQESSLLQVIYLGFYPCGRTKEAHVDVQAQIGTCWGTEGYESPHNIGIHLIAKKPDTEVYISKLFPTFGV